MAAPPGGRRRVLLACAAVGYAFLTSRIVWAWEEDFTGLDGFLFGNTYVWISLALLVFLPVHRVVPRSPSASATVEPAAVPQFDKLDRRSAAGQRHRIGRPLTVR